MVLWAAQNPGTAAGPRCCPQPVLETWVPLAGVGMLQGACGVTQGQKHPVGQVVGEASGAAVLQGVAEGTKVVHPGGQEA